MSEKTEKPDKNIYKDSLNLPKTDFDMKANLLNKEPVLQARWKQEDLYGRIRRERKGAKRFVLHDGPPYANGNIHVGTALNKVLKDMVVRIRTMEGCDSPYVPGWDCHGLPIEQKVADDLGKAKTAAMDPLEVRRLCREYAEKFQKVQSDQFQRLGVLGEFDRPYITMAPQYESAVMEVFAMLAEQGLVYKQLKPVHWSIENRTALADAELEYQDRKDQSIFVAFEMAPESGPRLFCPECKMHLLVWTTTPWTLPANLAVAIHPDFHYVVIRTDVGGNPMTMMLAEDRVDAVLDPARKAGIVSGPQKQLARFKGKELLALNLKYKHPLIEGKLCPVVRAEYVTLEDGTGLVHTAPGHGMEDYGTGLKNDLAIYCPVQADGTFDDTAPAWLRGVNVWKANPMVIDFLRNQGKLLLATEITHSYPHDWRSMTPTIFRATEQWFIGVDRPAKRGERSLRDMAKDVCRRNLREGGVDFVPAWGRNRIAGMLESRPDWCISRQRAWGLPIPAFYNVQGKPLLTPRGIRAVAAVVAKQGSDAWFKLTPAQLLEGYDPHKDHDLENPGEFDVSGLTVGRDIFDVWFESGSSWFAVCMKRGLVENLPIDLYLEGSDQHRGWFQLSLLPALGAQGRAPFATVVTHGFIVDEQGMKMSKKLGNTINVIDQLAKRGADILRLWIASVNYQDDVRCSESLIAQTEDSYRKIRNTLRFCMGACEDFDPAVNSTEPADHSIDRWMSMKLHELVHGVRAAYDAYEFHRATRIMYEFCTVQASSIYLSAVKDRLYCESPDAVRRRATQTVIHEMLLALTKLLAPILPHTCDEVWAHIPNRPAGEPDNVALAMLPDVDEDELALAQNITLVSPDAGAWAADNLTAGPGYVWLRLMELRDLGLIELEKLRNGGVKNPLDAEAVFQVKAANGPAGDIVETYIRELEDMLGVGYASVERVTTSESRTEVSGLPGGSDAAMPEGVEVHVLVRDAREKYKRCARSWKRRPDVGGDAEYPDLSARDAAVMRELKQR